MVPNQKEGKILRVGFDGTIILCGITKATFTLQA